MRGLTLPAVEGPTVLCLGSHSDDIEIGIGGTLLELTAAQPSAEIHWAVFSGVGERRGEAQAGAEAFAGSRLASLSMFDFTDGFFPGDFSEIKAAVRQLGTAVQPDLVFTHWRHDLHQDHRLVSELTRQTFRDALVLEYEILKYDGDLGAPNVFVPLGEETANRKIDLLSDVFGSQTEKYWFTDETFRSLMRIRGVECRSPSGYAEAFYGYKTVLEMGAVPGSWIGR